jgi:hypothetical protein
MNQRPEITENDYRDTVAAPAPSVKYFHGGFPDLRVGQFVLPPDVTKAPSTARFGGRGVCDTSKVYVVTDPHQAMIYAGMHQSGRGRFYEVQPVGKLLPDPDCLVPGVSFSCDKARVVRIIKLKGKTIKTIQKAMVRGE